MRWTLRIGLPLAVLLMAYTVWPFIDLYRLSRAIETRDLATIAERVEMRGVRPSITRQVLSAYLALTGKDAGMGAFGRDLAIGLGASAVQPVLADLASSGQVIGLFIDGWPRAAGGAERIEIAPASMAGLWSLYLSSEYRLNDFYVSAPPDLPEKQAFRIQLRLIQWKWKLYDVQLPEAYRRRLAQALIAAEKK